MLKASFKKHILAFNFPAGTSRGVLQTKDTYFLILRNQDAIGIGECGLLRGLSVDDRPDYEAKLEWVCEHIQLGLAALYPQLEEFPSIQMGLETAFRSLEASNPFQVFPSAFSRGMTGIPINGLVWMGDKEFMNRQISEKIKAGFRCLKMKIGALDFETELSLLQSIRKEFSSTDIELRVDANGAFQPAEALEKLKRLSNFELHSIEQPIATRQWDQMGLICEESPIPIALDEELIGLFSSEEKTKLLAQVNPQYIILKPSFIGGFRGTDSWIQLAEERAIRWWVTSALESNVGLNAISQYTYTKNSKLPQGLGTGSLYANNIEAPLKVRNGSIHYETHVPWNTELLF